jgi:hypothetical protein
MIISIFLAYFLFLIFSFLNFAITIFFISRNIVPVAISNTILNLLPIYLLSKYLIAPAKDKRIKMFFWISTVILSVILVIPYGAFVLDSVIDIFKTVAKM